MWEPPQANIVSMALKCAYGRFYWMDSQAAGAWAWTMRNWEKVILWNTRVNRNERLVEQRRWMGNVLGLSRASEWLKSVATTEMWKMAFAASHFHVRTRTHSHYRTRRDNVARLDVALRVECSRNERLDVFVVSTRAVVSSTCESVENFGNNLFWSEDKH